jgi:secreted protein with Ig-like and vWFA domain
MNALRASPGTPAVRPADYDNETPVGRSTETYQPIAASVMQDVRNAPLSTFSIDVDTASYANVRRYLNRGGLPPPDAVRLEELVNYFPYSYEPPAGPHPFSVKVDVAEAPWKPEHRLARIAIKGREVGMERQQANFVFLVDVSGSMEDANKLPLVRQSLLMLVDQLQEKDSVALVTYAGESRVAGESTSHKAKLRSAIQALTSGGSTNGNSGIQLAYEQAQKAYVKEGVNRVILCTDGDFNVGVSSPQELESIIQEKARTGVFLSVLGYGTGNLKDHTMETLADKGNGNYAYIDSLSEARKVLVEQMQGTLVTIAKDVKIQVEFNPAEVAAYRLLGYENRLLAKEDFNDDRKDAGEIGAGHTVTALYEIVPTRMARPDGRPLVDDLKYQPRRDGPVVGAAPVTPKSDDLLTVKLRYKQPDASQSTLLEVPVKESNQRLADAPRDFQFAASVAGFAMLLRHSPDAGALTWEQVRHLALKSKGEDALGYRGEFLQLIDKARGLEGGR